MIAIMHIHNASKGGLRLAFFNAINVKASCQYMVASNLSRCCMPISGNHPNPNGLFKYSGVNADHDQ